MDLNKKRRIKMDLKEKRKYLIIFLLIIILTVFIDQFTKFLVVKKMYLYQSIGLIKNFFYITYIENRGFLMGIGGRLNDGSTFNGVVIITIIAISILIGYFVYIYKKNIINKYLIINFSILLGGAIGNFIDRLFRKKVIDFFEIKIPPFLFKGFYYSSLPIFNFADFFVTIGIIMLLIYYIFLESKFEKEIKANDNKKITENIDNKSNMFNANNMNNSEIDTTVDTVRNDRDDKEEYNVDQ